MKLLLTLLLFEYKLELATDIIVAFDHLNRISEVIRSKVWIFSDVVFDKQVLTILFYELVELNLARDSRNII